MVVVIIVKFALKDGIDKIIYLLFLRIITIFVKKIMNKTLLPPITLDNALEAYKNADENGKKLLENLHGKEIFIPTDIRQKVRSFEDICKMAGRSPIFFDIDQYAPQDGKSRNAYDKLVLIARVLNEGWKPNYYNTSEHRYYPFFNYNVDTGSFLYSNYFYNSKTTYVDSRLVFKSPELAEFAGKLFINIYNEYLKY